MKQEWAAYSFKYPLVKSNFQFKNEEEQIYPTWINPNFMLQVSSKSNDSKLYSSFELLKQTLVISEFEENNNLSDLRKFEIKITNYFLLKPKLYPLDTGRLLNVFCKFKLRPVSRGYTSLLLYHLPFTLLNSTYFNENSFCSVIHNTVILNPF